MPIVLSNSKGRGGEHAQALCSRSHTRRANPLIVIALDTCLGACSVAVLNAGHVLVSRVEPMSRGHQERLAPLVAEAMIEARLSFDQLDRVGVTIGPGSFTGLRVGLAFAKGLGQALAIPVIGVGTLQAIAAPFFNRPGVIFAVLTAKPGHVFVQAFERGQSLTEPEGLSIDTAVALMAQISESRRVTLVGTGVEHFARFTTDRTVVEQADPVVVARLAAKASIQPPQPLYLRAPDAKLPGGLDLTP